MKILRRLESLVHLNESCDAQDMTDENEQKVTYNNMYHSHIIIIRKSFSIFIPYCPFHF